MDNTETHSTLDGIPYKKQKNLSSELKFGYHGALPFQFFIRYTDLSVMSSEPETNLSFSSSLEWWQACQAHSNISQKPNPPHPDLFHISVIFPFMYICIYVLEC